MFTGKENNDLARMKDINKNISGFKKAKELNYQKFVEVLREYMVNGKGTKDIDLYVFDVEGRGWVSWCILRYLGIEKNRRKTKKTRNTIK